MSLREQVLAYLEKRIERTVYDTWCPRLEFVEGADGIVQVPAANPFVRDWLERDLRAPLEEAFLRLFGRVPTLVFKVVDGDAISASVVPLAAPPALPIPSPISPPSEINPGLILNPRHLFDTFVVGPTNRFAHAAALAVSENPGGHYNPLFIHGGVGLGKTHLLQAICHALLKRNPYAKILYLSCEGFVNDYIAHIQKKRIDEFRRRYRNADLLVVDDVHFLVGKEGSQEEFFHTFNDLHIAQRQIVLSSDQPATDIATLKAHLMSRFRMGLEARIDPPTFEMRLAIVHQKAEEHGHVFAADVASYIASTSQTNIRELEGNVTKVMALSVLTRTLDLETAREALKDRAVPRISALSVREIQDVVARYYGRTLAEFRTHTWTKSISRPRQICMFLCRKLTPLSLAEIGESFGGKDHATVIYTCKKIEKLAQTDPTVMADLERLTRELQTRP